MTDNYRLVEKSIGEMFDYFCRLGCENIPRQMVHSDMIIYVLIKYLEKVDLHLNLYDFISNETLEKMDKNVKLIDKYLLSYNASYKDTIEYSKLIISHFYNKLSFKQKNELWETFYNEIKKY